MKIDSLAARLMIHNINDDKYIDSVVSMPPNSIGKISFQSTRWGRGTFIPKYHEYRNNLKKTYVRRVGVYVIASVFPIWVFWWHQISQFRIWHTNQFWNEGATVSIYIDFRLFFPFRKRDIPLYLVIFVWTLSK